MKSSLLQCTRLLGPGGRWCRRHFFPPGWATGDVRVITLACLAVIPILDLSLRLHFGRGCLRGRSRLYYHDRRDVRIRVGVDRPRIEIPRSSDNPPPARSSVVRTMMPSTGGPDRAMAILKMADIVWPTPGAILDASRDDHHRARHHAPRDVLLLKLAAQPQRTGQRQSTRK